MSEDDEYALLRSSDDCNDLLEANILENTANSRQKEAMMVENVRSTNDRAGKVSHGRTLANVGTVPQTVKHLEINAVWFET